MSSTISSEHSALKSEGMLVNSGAVVSVTVMFWTPTVSLKQASTAVNVRVNT